MKERRGLDKVLADKNKKCDVEFWSDFSKTFAIQCSFTDHLKLKIVNKTTCSMPSTNPRLQQAH